MQYFLQIPYCGSILLDSSLSVRIMGSPEHLLENLNLHFSQLSPLTDIRIGGAMLWVCPKLLRFSRPHDINIISTLPQWSKTVMFKMSSSSISAVFSQELMQMNTWTQSRAHWNRNPGAGSFSDSWIPGTQEKKKWIIWARSYQL